MTRLDERLKHDLARAARLADPSGVYEHLIRRKERRRIVRKAQSGLLAVAVIVGAIAGFYGLSLVFRSGGATPGVNPSPVAITPRENGLVAYSLVTPDGIELHTVREDGTGDRVLPSPPGQPWLVSWSPDGSQIAVAIFPSQGGRRAIWVMNADGSGAKQIASAENVSVPSWSPDGAAIAYAARVDGRTEIHLVASDGTGDRVIHGERAEGTFAIFSAQFSPDGRHILFDRGTDSGFDLFVMGVDGSDVRRLTTTGTDSDPDWSPDGTRIAFTRQEIVQVGGESRVTSDIFVMNADGGDVRRLTHGGGESTYLYPQWSPDGTKIAYVAGVTGGPGALVIMNADGSEPRRLVDSEVLGISWQPLPATAGTVEPSPTATEEPSPSVSSEPGRDIGLAFPVCNVTSVDGHFVDRKGRQTAYVATKMSDVGGCPPADTAFNVVAVDLNGDDVADVSYGPIGCQGGCRAFATPDVDGDGTDELLVVQVEFSILGLRLYDVGPAGEPGADGVALLPLKVAPPGDPEGGFEPGAEAQLWQGGDAFELDALTCASGADGRVLIATSAHQIPPDSADSVWKAHETTFALADGELRVVGTRDFQEPVTSEAPSFASGEGLCGARLGP